MNDNPRRDQDEDARRIIEADLTEDNHLSLADWLAINRTRLANERTLLAYVRTAMMFGISGATVLKLFPHESAMRVSAIVLIAFGGSWALLGIYRFFSTRRQMNLMKRRTNEAIKAGGTYPPVDELLKR